MYAIVAIVESDFAAGYCFFSCTVLGPKLHYNCTSSDMENYYMIAGAVCILAGLLVVYSKAVIVPVLKKYA